MKKIKFTRVIRRQGTEGNLYVTIPRAIERLHEIMDGDLAEVSMSVSEGEN